LENDINDSNSVAHAQMQAAMVTAQLKAGVQVAEERSAQVQSYLAKK
jgi:hypothetical protein